MLAVAVAADGLAVAELDAGVLSGTAMTRSRCRVSWPVTVRVNVCLLKVSVTVMLARSATNRPQSMWNGGKLSHTGKDGGAVSSKSEFSGPM